ncbi:hypothetical protein [Croceibacterium ferulae]|uniref:hypothetical protein n=1 Tax=Croceibacterium ferulae TaxID=1854641 RepID=UPI000F86AB1F|nr:hypothetical protein [Croceibacterium ferulae]
MTSSIAGMRIVRDLRAAECALDEALLKTNVLFGTLISARQETKEAGPFTGHELLQRLIKSQQTLLTAGSDLARVHGGLSNIGREMGAAVHDCPPDGPIGLGEDDVARIAA